MSFNIGNRIRGPKIRDMPSNVPDKEAIYVVTGVRSNGDLEVETYEEVARDGVTKRWPGLIPSKDAKKYSDAP